MIEHKYRGLIDVLFSVAQLSERRPELYTVDDDKIYEALKKLEPELYAERVKSLGGNSNEYL